MTGEQLMLDGMARAVEAVPDWITMARSAIDELAGTGTEFTAEDVTALVGMPRPEDPDMNRQNAVGAVIAGAARAGRIQHTGRYRRAVRPSRHAAILAIWTGAR